MLQEVSHNRDEHPLVFADEFATLADFGVFLMHKRDYEEAARLTRQGCVLDLGCNNGYGSRILAGAGARVVGVDVSATAIADAIRRFGSGDIEFRAFEGDRLPFEDGRFDAVVSCQVIEHIQKLDSYLSEIVRVLRPAGEAIFTTPNKAIRLDAGMEPWNRYHVQEFTDSELRGLLSRYFATVEIRGQFATRELHRIERTRCATSRTLARDTTGARLVRTLRARTPAFLRGFLRALRDRNPKHLRNDVYSESDGKGYTTADYFYRDTGISDALSLFAVARKAAAG